MTGSSPKYISICERSRSVVLGNLRSRIGIPQLRPCQSSDRFDRPWTPAAGSTVSAPASASSVATGVAAGKLTDRNSAESFQMT
jgi:hypothetical protein